VGYSFQTEILPYTDTSYGGDGTQTLRSCLLCSTRQPPTCSQTIPRSSVANVVREALGLERSMSVTHLPLETPIPRECEPPEILSAHSMTLLYGTSWRWQRILAARLLSDGAIRMENSWAVISKFTLLPGQSGFSFTV
jgi:hypothetical protein